MDFMLFVAEIVKDEAAAIGRAGYPAGHYGNRCVANIIDFGRINHNKPYWK